MFKDLNDIKTDSDVIISNLLSTIKDLKRKIEQLNSKIEQLKEQNSQLDKTIMFLKMM